MGIVDYDNQQEDEHLYRALLSRIPMSLVEDQDNSDVDAKNDGDVKVKCRTLKPTSALFQFLETSLVEPHGISIDNVDVVQDEEKETSINDDKNIDKYDKESKDTKRRSTFAFITFKDKESCQKAIEIGTLKYKKQDSKKKKSYRMYILPKTRKEDTDTSSNSRICYLWKAGRCTHGDNCKFLHDGPGSCLPTVSKKEKCRTTSKSFQKKDKCDQDCINWKTKGKCRRKEKGQCPYKHDEALKEKALLKKQKKRDKNESTTEVTNDKVEKKRKKKGRNESRQPLSIRVFGLCYDTTESDVREYFEHCGNIVEITFPTFEDSGRSKGYCGILFQSPKAVQKALELHESELHGRWLSVQEGKMYLKQWEENTEQQQLLRKVSHDDEELEKPLVGEFGQKVKRRRKHGFKDETN